MAEDDQVAAKGDTTESDGSETGLIAKIKSDKKLMIMVGGGAYFFFCLLVVRRIIFSQVMRLKAMLQ